MLLFNFITTTRGKTIQLQGENKISCNFAVTAKHLTRSAAVQYNVKTLDELSATIDARPTRVYMCVWVCMCVCTGVCVGR